nr:hypothetical protein [Frankia sp. EI5c]
MTTATRGTGRPAISRRFSVIATACPFYVVERYLRTCGDAVVEPSGR